MAAKAPKSVNIRMYNVGFGDCFLLTFKYTPRKTRNVLIDFGTLERPKGAKKDHMLAIARDIKQTVKRKRLDMVVATHRHQDHISGFSNDGTAKSPGHIIAGMRPKAVLQPWTEDPDLPRSATGVPGVTEADRLYINAVHDVQGLVGNLTSRLRYVKNPRSDLDFAKNEIKCLGEANLTNRSAVENLRTMVRRKKDRYYLNYGRRVDFDKLLPGVRITVLGPPTLDQAGGRLSAAAESDEYWVLDGHGFRAMAERIESAECPDAHFDRVRDESRISMDARWFRGQMHRIFVEQLHHFVRILDDVLNNTSLILLFEVGGKSLLFCGDAQLENWARALRKDGRMLAGVDVYKVGHHGSRNATPRTLWDKFRNKGPEGRPNRLVCLLSTKQTKKFSNVAKGTEVPRIPLTLEMTENSDVHSTQDAADRLFIDIPVDL